MSTWSLRLRAGSGRHWTVPWPPVLCCYPVEWDVLLNGMDRDEDLDGVPGRDVCLVCCRPARLVGSLGTSRTAAPVEATRVPGRYINVEIQAEDRDNYGAPEQ